MADWRSKPRNGGSMSTDEMLDTENQRRVSGLADKVSLLRGIALDIETESKDSNRYLDGMGNDFSGSQGLLSGSMHRLNHMVSSGKNNRKLMCYVILGLVLLFIVTYYLIARIRGVASLELGSQQEKSSQQHNASGGNMTVSYLEQT